MATQTFLCNNTSFNFNCTVPGMNKTHTPATTCPVCKVPASTFCHKFGHFTSKTSSGSGTDGDGDVPMDGSTCTSWNPTRPSHTQPLKDIDNDVIMGNTDTGISLSRAGKQQVSLSTDTADKMDIDTWTVGASGSMFTSMLSGGQKPAAKEIACCSNEDYTSDVW
ncbi:uncharacterized protein DSM5745_09410 [Aspergillus mulundensis]|uniref:Uncharacterized protein n=1 Tax=Aspergillus mulundensis TaxID=1810919 RepID=A0A3D8QVF6_9EURO|nr:hypothetical protein DSM5745_09410 [Aspergillus mulundensis]RDW65671.1 hypothetical protein DSM5745_09410 [Aspergillus mulundensis]